LKKSIIKQIHETELVKILEFLMIIIFLIFIGYYL
jgi:hypothetical protein